MKESTIRRKFDETPLTCSQVPDVLLDLATNIDGLLGIQGWGDKRIRQLEIRVSDTLNEERDAVAAARAAVDVKRLGQTRLEYGEFRGRTLDEVPLERLVWYLDMARKNARQLEAYLQSPAIRVERERNEV